MHNPHEHVALAPDNSDDSSGGADGPRSSACPQLDRFPGRLGHHALTLT